MPSMPTCHVNKGSQFGFLDTTLGSLNDTVSLSVPPVRALQPAPLARPCPRPHDATFWRRLQ
jgi:hypothetical protein